MPDATADCSAVIPVPKLENDFYDWWARHDAKRREAAAGPHDLVFIGDSITHLFEGDPGGQMKRGERVWEDFYAGRRALNLGFGWDRTQNVLWRLAHGEFTGQTPKLVVLLIGTNNLTGTPNAPVNTPSEIAKGILAVCDELLVLSPASHILVMGILPRGASATDPFRPAIRELNALLEEATASRDQILFADIGQRFLEDDGTLPGALMNDGTHPTEDGYRIWAEAIEPIISDYVGPRV